MCYLRIILILTLFVVGSLSSEFGKHCTAQPRPPQMSGSEMCGLRTRPFADPDPQDFFADADERGSCFMTSVFFPN